MASCPELNAQVKKFWYSTPLHNHIRCVCSMKNSVYHMHYMHWNKVYYLIIYVVFKTEFSGKNYTCVSYFDLAFAQTFDLSEFVVHSGTTLLWNIISIVCQIVWRCVFHLCVPMANKFREFVHFNSFVFFNQMSGYVCSSKRVSRVLSGTKRAYQFHQIYDPDHDSYDGII